MSLNVFRPMSETAEKLLKIKAVIEERALQPKSVVSHKLAMVCREYYDRILKRAGLFEGIKYLANALVNKIDHRVSITYPLVALMRAEHAGLIFLAGYARRG